MINGYTKGSLCECRHTYIKHFNYGCMKCDCKKFKYTTNRKIANKINIKSKLQEWENKLYGLNSQVVSLQWIGLRKKPTDDEIAELNQFLGELIKDIREVKEELQ